MTEGPSAGAQDALHQRSLRSYDADIPSPMPIIGHGIDVVEIARISDMLDRHADRFLDRCFTPGEQAYAADRKRRAEHLAGRFAAKEAAMKAIGTGWRSGIAWTDIETIIEPSGAPRLVVHARVNEIATDLGVKRWHVSISHTDTLATASVIAESI